MLMKLVKLMTLISIAQELDLGVVFKKHVKRKR